MLGCAAGRCHCCAGWARETRHLHSMAQDVNVGLLGCLTCADEAVSHSSAADVGFCGRARQGTPHAASRAHRSAAAGLAAPALS